MILHTDYEHRMWIAAMAADMAGAMACAGHSHTRKESANIADAAVEEYRKRCAVEPGPTASTALSDGWERPAGASD